MDAASSTGTTPAPGRGKGRMLVVRGGALGDFILTLPVLSALRRAFPSTHLEVLAYPRPAQLAVEAGIVDAARALESRGLAGFFARKGALDPEWSGYFESFNVVLSYLYDPDRHFQDNVGRVSRAQFLEGPHKPQEPSELHAAQQLLRPLERLAIFDADPLPRLTALGAGDIVPGPGRRRVVAHPGSGGARKNWPEPRWRELLERLDARGDLDVDLVGGEAEAGRLPGLARGLETVRCVVSEPLPLLARRMAGASLFVGHDSGVTHLAAAMGVRGLVLWGPTCEAVWRPRSERFMSLRHAQGLEGLPVDVVESCLLDLLEREAGPGNGSLPPP
jgi:ADP-heptose:LPS heptosyltransferase